MANIGSENSIDRVLGSGSLVDLSDKRVFNRPQIKYPESVPAELKQQVEEMKGELEELSYLLTKPRAFMDKYNSLPPGLQFQVHKYLSTSGVGIKGSQYGAMDEDYVVMFTEMSTESALPDNLELKFPGKNLVKKMGRDPEAPPGFEYVDLRSILGGSGENVKKIDPRLFIAFNLKSIDSLIYPNEDMMGDTNKPKPLGQLMETTVSILRQKAQELGYEINGGDFAVRQVLHKGYEVISQKDWIPAPQGDLLQ